MIKGFIKQLRGVLDVNYFLLRLCNIYAGFLTVIKFRLMVLHVIRYNGIIDKIIGKISGNQKKTGLPGKENHIRQNLLDHLLRHFALTGDLRPSGCCLTNFVDDPCGILDIVLGCAF